MIYNHLNFFSVTLCNHVDVDILLPSMGDNDAYLCKDLDRIYEKKTYPVLYLLHGALDDRTMWVRNTSIETYAQEKELVVVMPSAQNSFYVNAKAGLNYYSFVADELPKVIAKYFPISEKREDTFIAGYSMGGYGATRIALGNPERFASFADLSGAVDPETLEPLMSEMGFDFFRYDLIFGGADKVKGSKNDVYQLAADLKDAVLKPEVHIYCGLDDSANHKMNLKLYETLKDNGFTAHFTDGPGGHDWAYWDKSIRDYISKIRIEK